MGEWQHIMQIKVNVRVTTHVRARVCLLKERASP